MDKKTEWVVKGPFGVRRIRRDDKGPYFLVGNVPYRNYDPKLKFYKATTISEEVQTS